MATVWYAVFVIDTGALDSTGTVVADDATLAASGRAARQLDGRPDFSLVRWDKDQRAFVAITPPESSSS